MSRGEKHVIHGLRNCKETQKLRDVCKKNWLQMNKETGFKRIVECTKITDLRNSGIFLYKDVKIRRRSADTGAVNTGGLE
jgi:hypothetical protein